MASHNVIGVERFAGVPVKAGGVEAEYRIGDAVRFSTVPFDEAEVGLVTAVLVAPGCFCYVVSWSGGRDARHYGFELAPAPES